MLLAHDLDNLLCRGAARERVEGHDAGGVVFCRGGRRDRSLRRSGDARRGDEVTRVPPAHNGERDHGEHRENASAPKHRKREANDKRHEDDRDKGNELRHGAAVCHACRQAAERHERNRHGKADPEKETEASVLGALVRAWDAALRGLGSSRRSISGRRSSLGRRRRLCAEALRGRTVPAGGALLGSGLYRRGSAHGDSPALDAFSGTGP